MLDACKACRLVAGLLAGPSTAAGALYRSRLVRAENKWDDDSFWNPQTDADKELAKALHAGHDAGESVRRRCGNSNPWTTSTLTASPAPVEYGHKIGLQIPRLGLDQRRRPRAGGLRK